MGGRLWEGGCGREAVGGRLTLNLMGRALQAAGCSTVHDHVANPNPNPHPTRDPSPSPSPNSSRWSGSFMIKWTFIKDIPNNQVRGRVRVS